MNTQNAHIKASEIFAEIIAARAVKSDFFKEVMALSAETRDSFSAYHMAVNRSVKEMKRRKSHETMTGETLPASSRELIGSVYGARMLQGLMNSAVRLLIAEVREIDQSDEVVKAIDYSDLENIGLGDAMHSQADADAAVIAERLVMVFRAIQGHLLSGSAHASSVPVVEMFADQEREEGPDGKAIWITLATADEWHDAKILAAESTGRFIDEQNAKAEQIAETFDYSAI